MNGLVTREILRTEFGRFFIRLTVACAAMLALAVVLKTFV